MLELIFFLCLCQDVITGFQTIAVPEKPKKKS